MFVREKTARGHSYLYLVENEREGGRIRQRIIRPLGRKDVLMATGELDRLVASLVRHCDRAIIPGLRRGRLVWGDSCQAVSFRGFLSTGVAGAGAGSDDPRGVRHRGYSPAHLYSGGPRMGPGP